MFEELLAENFQKHSYKKVNLSANASVISGPSDSGKSSLIRAIRWVCLNQPQGDGFIKEGESEAKCALIVDGHTIERIRGKSENLYKLDGKEYRAFGQGVPDDIAAVLNVGDINFQGQHDSVFWFSETAGEVSRQLNAVVDLGVIDTALWNIGSKVRVFQQTVQISKSRLDKAKERKKELEWVAVADSEYRGIESLEVATNALEARSVALVELVSSYRNAEKTRQQAACVAGEARYVGLIGVDARKANDRFESLNQLIESAKQTQKIIDAGYPDVDEINRHFEKLTELSRKSEDIRTIRATYTRYKGCVDAGYPDVTVLEDLVSQYDKASGQALFLHALISGLKSATVDYQSAASELGASLAELEKASDGVCPVCGKEMR